MDRAGGGVGIEAYAAPRDSGQPWPKNGLMDWGFGDAVMALGPMQEILSAGIRELLVKSLQSAGVDLRTAGAEDAGQEFYIITHSLGSYLSLAALDPDWLGKQGPELPQFKITPEERTAVDYFSAHTAGFYFLANQIELLELARLSTSDESVPDQGLPTTPATKLAPPLNRALGAEAAALSRAAGTGSP